MDEPVVAGALVRSGESGMRGAIVALTESDDQRSPVNRSVRSEVTPQPCCPRGGAKSTGATTIALAPEESGEERWLRAGVVIARLEGAREARWPLAMWAGGLQDWADSGRLRGDGRQVERGRRAGSCGGGQRRADRGLGRAAVRRLAPLPQHDRIGYAAGRRSRVHALPPAARRSLTRHRLRPR